MVIKSRRIRWTEQEGRMGEMREVLVGNSEGKSPLGRSRRRWENSIRMYLREIGWEVVSWTHLAHVTDQWRPFVNMIMNLRVP
jgi:hypothetical protein